MTIKIVLVLQIVNCFFMMNTSFANFTDVYKETDNAAKETTEASVIYTTTYVKHTPTSTRNVNSQAFSADPTGVQYSENDEFLLARKIRKRTFISRKNKTKRPASSNHLWHVPQVKYCISIYKIYFNACYWVLVR